ncbi:MAG: gluconate 2-dehydrogenase subunit 3 family protein [Bacteroidota bacterium]
MKRRDALKHTAVLGGTAAFSGTLLSLLQACQSTPRLEWQPKFLSVDHAQLVSALVDTILPKTDTPGGLDVKVDMLIDLLWAETTDENQKQAILTQMDQFNEICIAKFGKVFHELDAKQRHSILEEAEANDPKFGGSVWGYPVGPQAPVGFYRAFKSVAIMGYCTSEEIGKNYLKYDPVPGKYQECVPLDDVDGVWSY